MSNVLSLKILSPSEVCFTGEIISVKVQGTLGEMEVFSDHTNLISSILPGYISVTPINTKTSDKFFSTGGYIEIHDNSVSLILDDFYKAGDLDAEFFDTKLDVLLENLNTLNFKSDLEFDKLTQEIGLYRQYR